MKDYLLIETNIVFLSKNNALQEVVPDSIRTIGDMEKNPYGNTCLVSPQGIKLILPQRMIELEVVPSRVVLSDKKGLKPNQSDLLGNYAKKFITVSPNYKFSLYGFNYIAEIDYPKQPKFLSSNIINKIVNNSKLEHQHFSISYTEKGLLYRIFMESIIPNMNKYRFTLNCEHKGDSFDLPKVTNHYQNGFNNFERILNEL